MSDDLLVEQVVPQHPYQETQEKPFVCNPEDKECVARLVQAFSDCD